MNGKLIYYLSEVVQFNPQEKLFKGTIAKKVTMDKLQPFTRNIGDYELASYTGGAKFRNGDTIMARITPCLENGKTALVSILDDNEVGFGSTEYIVLRNKDGLTDSRFVYYFATNPWFRDIAIKSMVGSSGRQRVQQSVLENLEVGIPPLPTQRRIAQILGSLDDKIELNRRINDNLAA
jgi:type I restriction enzyme S subunit